MTVVIERATPWSPRHSRGDWFPRPHLVECLEAPDECLQLAISRRVGVHALGCWVAQKRAIRAASVRSVFVRLS